eukprot:GGOE01012353.1.p1 GENE.GGOE01012353.1~~GGOE01012353.1.p1  ORF type:complete len:119 (-),score=0.78 GGOE01012353.1:129-485(-)
MSKAFSLFACPACDSALGPPIAVPGGAHVVCAPRVQPIIMYVTPAVELVLQVVSKIRLHFSFSAPPPASDVDVCSTAVSGGTRGVPGLAFVYLKYVCVPYGVYDPPIDFPSCFPSSVY